jgi:aspartate/methionine/tyrosine aminotransferase
VEGVVDLGYGEPNFDTPEHIREAAKKALDDGHTHYVLPVEGLTPLREAIAEKLARENNITADPATEVLVTAGVQEAINVALLSVVNPGDEVIMPDPYYYVDPLGTILAGGTPVYTYLTEENDFRLDIADVASKITPRTKAIIYISPNCPTGSVFPREDLEALARLAAEKQIFLITDEIYEKLVYDGTEHVSIASLPEARDITISMFGFSKAYAMTGWRIGFLAAPPELVRTMLEVHGQLVLCTNSIAQRAAVAALTGPQDCIEEMRVEYEARRNVFVEGLNRLGFVCKPPLGSFYIYSNITGLGLTSSELAKHLAQEARVISYPGTAFTNAGDGEKYLRFSYTKDMSELTSGLERIEAAVAKL